MKKEYNTNDYQIVQYWIKKYLLKEKRKKKKIEKFRQLIRINYNKYFYNG